MTQISQIFQYEDEEKNVLETARPHDMCGLSKVVDVVKRGKAGSEKAKAYINQVKWDLWDEYKTSFAEYEKEFAEIEAYNALHAENPEVEAKPYPTKPAWSDDDLPALTVADVLNMPEVLAAKKEVQKSKRQLELDDAAVTVDGMVFDANEKSRHNIMFALEVAKETGQTETDWKLKNNEWANITLSQLKAVLVAAGVELQRIMVKYG